MAFCWRAAFSAFWILSHLVKSLNNKKNLVKVGPTVAKLSGSVHVDPESFVIVGGGREFSSKVLTTFY